MHWEIKWKEGAEQCLAIQSKPYFFLNKTTFCAYVTSKKKKNKVVIQQTEISIEEDICNLTLANVDIHYTETAEGGNQPFSHHICIDAIRLMANSIPPGIQSHLECNPSITDKLQY